MLTLSPYEEADEMLGRTKKKASGIMKESGFNILKVYGDYDGSVYTLSSGRLITISRKC